MTDNNHPITPPAELVLQWLEESPKHGEFGISQYIATQAARWGADMELEACCEWLETGPYGFSIEATAPSLTKRLRNARRPEPPSLKEQALADLAGIPIDPENGVLVSAFDNIRRALESLPE